MPLVIDWKRVSMLRSRDPKYLRTSAARGSGRSSATAFAKMMAKAYMMIVRITTAYARDFSVPRMEYTSTRSGRMKRRSRITRATRRTRRIRTSLKTMSLSSEAPCAASPSCLTRVSTMEISTRVASSRFHCMSLPHTNCLRCATIRSTSSMKKTTLHRSITTPAPCATGKPVYSISMPMAIKYITMTAEKKTCVHILSIKCLIRCGKDSCEGNDFVLIFCSGSHTRACTLCDSRYALKVLPILRRSCSMGCSVGVAVTREPSVCERPFPDAGLVVLCRSSGGNPWILRRSVNASSSARS
mmetsp:Transcript_121340/g.343813  ORF Transcript_121340/g.343813 Transcript_121340/m.343813 type:complete len:300 (+) Transcript_121340:103-1002(+)